MSAKPVVTFAMRIDPALYERIKAEAAARNLSMSFLATHALTEFLDRLIPADEFSLTREVAE